MFWQQFSTTFVATNTNTTIGFFNGDPAGDLINGLDNIAIGDAVASVPGPIAGAGLPGMVFAGGGIVERGGVPLLLQPPD
jgi:hypothetical protein